MSEQDLLERFRALDLDYERLGLMQRDFDEPYYCTPVGAEIVGELGVDGVHFCRIPSLDPEMIFAVSPSPCGEHCVAPVAGDAKTFFRLLLACGGANALEQASWMSEAQFEHVLAEERASMEEDRRRALDQLRKVLDLEPHPWPYPYIKSLQKGFDCTTIPFSEEYYEATGEPTPSGAEQSPSPLWETEMTIQIDISDQT